MGYGLYVPKGCRSVVCDDVLLWFKHQDNTGFTGCSSIFDRICEKLFLFALNVWWASQVVHLPAGTGDAGGMGSIPGLWRSPGGADGNPLQYACLGNSMDRGGWQLAQSRT